VKLRDWGGVALNEKKRIIISMEEKDKDSSEKLSGTKMDRFEK